MYSKQSVLGRKHLPTLISMPSELVRAIVDVAILYFVVDFERI